jgi:hypothetical protein
MDKETHFSGGFLINHTHSLILFLFQVRNVHFCAVYEFFSSPKKSGPGSIVHPSYIVKNSGM